MSKTIIDITGNNLDSTVDINEYRDYIYVGARNIIRRYVKNQTSGEVQEIEEVKWFDVNRCNNSYFETEYEKGYISEKNYLDGYCLEN